MHIWKWALFAALASSTYEWPDPQQNGIVLVNANQDIATYLKNHADYFQKGELVVDLSISNQPDITAAQRERNEIVELLNAHGMSVGTYTSGTTVGPLADTKQWPYEKVPIEWMPKGFASAGAWPGDPDRKILDVTDARTRRGLQDGIRRIWQQCPAPVRFVDNAASHSSTGGKQPWQAYCANIREIRMIGESLDSRLVFNVSLHPAYLSDAEAVQLIDAVGPGNGILLEDPWGEATRKSPDLTRQAQSRYRQLLGRGIVVVMLPVNIPSDTLLDWLATWRKPSDRLYIGWPFWKQPWNGKRPWEGSAK
ncbi:MAG: hypothetical protein ACLP59_22405 [Bryobacteraceae bacterium]